LAIIAENSSLWFAAPTGQDMDLPVWQGAVTCWQRRIQAAERHSANFRFKRKLMTEPDRTSKSRWCT